MLAYLTAIAYNFQSKHDKTQLNVIASLILIVGFVPFIARLINSSLLITKD